ncbi:hypothetical protein KGF56_004044 [Candida oxycetoniae]|uniref:Uncharacterized protein n=1 Tax=Candida oxycetoniae TaxID=497107 RepID=A0AAI9SU85_9ASCO|nr:uncharacterized protein KGF56_004044 [Candida oxycetoniae]KAI3403155.2 hypothetical protein KGF56_004044 [Candida oxycetoniae]
MKTSHVSTTSTSSSSTSSLSKFSSFLNKTSKIFHFSKRQHTKLDSGKIKPDSQSNIINANDRVFKFNLYPFNVAKNNDHLYMEENYYSMVSARSVSSCKRSRKIEYVVVAEQSRKGSLLYAASKTTIESSSSATLQTSVILDQDIEKGNNDNVEDELRSLGSIS